MSATLCLSLHYQEITALAKLAQLTKSRDRTYDELVDSRFSFDARALCVKSDGSRREYRIIDRSMSRVYQYMEQESVLYYPQVSELHVRVSYLEDGRGWQQYATMHAQVRTATSAILDNIEKELDLESTDTSMDPMIIHKLKRDFKGDAYSFLDVPAATDQSSTDASTVVPQSGIAEDA